MEEFRLRSARYCPFLTAPFGDGVWSYAGPPACRLPSGQLRTLWRHEVQRLCVEGRYHDCPGYRFWRAAGPRLAWSE